MNRKVLYGYQIQHGEIAVHPVEVDVVRQVFTLYLSGLSYQKIADTLNSENIPFSQDAPLWNKHKVKRLLENPRYTGKYDHPALVDDDTFQAVQERIGEKAASIAPKKERPVRKLRLLCECCDCRLLRLGGPNHKKDIQYLKCEGCGTLVTISDAALLDEVARQWAAHGTPATEAYRPSEEVVRLTNAINQGLEHPEQPEKLVSLIQQGISARYACCQAAPTIGNNNRLAEVDWNHFSQAVSHITISAENVATVYFKQE